MRIITIYHIDVYITIQALCKMSTMLALAVADCAFDAQPDQIKDRCWLPATLVLGSSTRLGQGLDCGLR